MNRLVLILLLPFLGNSQKEVKEYLGDINFKDVIEIKGLIYCKTDTSLVSGRVIKYNKKSISKKYILVSKGKPDNLGWIPINDKVEMPEESVLGSLLTIPIQAFGNNINYPGEDYNNLNRTDRYLSKQRENNSKAYHDMLERNDLNAQNNVSNKKINGFFVEYFKNGKPKIKGNYKDGKLDGKWEEYHKNGHLKSQGNYIDGNKDGEWTDFNKNGELIKKVSWNEGKQIVQN